MKAKNITDKVIGVLGWKEGKLIKDDLMISGTRKVNNLLKFSLSKGRSITVTTDHIMVVSDKEGNLSTKEAVEVKAHDYIPIVLDGFKDQVASDHQIIIKLYKEIDLSLYEVFVEGVPESLSETLKPYLSFHQYRAFRRERYSCVPLKACLEAGINIDSYRFKTGKTGTLVPTTFIINEVFARLVGYYLSEGCVSDDRVYISFSVKEKDLIKDVENILKKLKIQFSIMIGYWKGHKSSYTFKISSPLLALYFSKFGINSLDKTIPYFIFHSNQNIKDNLLSGVLRGDGSMFISNQGNYWAVNLSTASQLLAEGIDALCREKGILASIGRLKGLKTKSYIWSLDVSERESVQKLLPLFTPRQIKKVKVIGMRAIKSPSYSRVKSLALLNIKNIEIIKKLTTVYSLETRNHYYITSWGILTHNCLPKDLISLKGYAKELGVDTEFLDSVWDYNLRVRKTRDWEEIPFVVTKTSKEQILKEDN